MEPINFEMSLWTLNQKYNRINNCKVVKPTYEIDWYYDNSFFLDKRDWLQKIIESSWDNFLDYKTVNWIDYILSHNGNSLKIYSFTNWVLTHILNKSFDISWFYSKLLKWVWISWSVIWTWAVSKLLKNQVYWRWQEYIDNWFVDWYVAFWVNYQINWDDHLYVWDYIVFESWPLQWWIYQIMDADWVKDRYNHKGSLKPNLAWWLWITYLIWSTNNRNRIEYIPWTRLTVPAEYRIRELLNWTMSNFELSFSIVTTTTNNRTWVNFYIQWTNSAWSIPLYWDTFKIFRESTTVSSNTLIISNWTWIETYIVNWINNLIFSWSISFSKNIYDGIKIVDYEIYDWLLWVLTNRSLHYSERLKHSNTFFYPLKYFLVLWWQKLLACWKSLILFWDVNKIYAPVNSTEDSVTYSWYDANYNWDLYSKDSCIFADQTIYVLQKDKQLKKIDIIQNNSITFDLVVNNVLENTIWLFNGLSAWWTVSITHSQRMLNFIYNNWSDNNTTIYQYDKMYKHFIENTYSYKINIFDRLILANGFIFTEWWLTDNWNEYEQVITFMIDTKTQIYKPYIIRTLFGMLDTKIDLSLSITSELGGKLTKQVKTLNNFLIDKRLTTELTWDDIIWWDTLPLDNNEYNWTTVSIQSNILQVWRFIKFKYNSYNRFCIWDSYVITDSSKAFINEPLLTN